VLERVRIVLRTERELAIGDALLVDDTPLGIVARFVPDSEMPRNPNGEAADLIIPAAVGSRFGLRANEIALLAISKGDERGDEALKARSMELYSLISLQPLGRWYGPGQRINVSQIRWLRSRGFSANVAELASLKSDDLKNRQAMWQLCRSHSLRAEHVPNPSAPETLASLRVWLMALGLEVRLERHLDHVDLTVQPALTEEVLAWSKGAVTRPETLHYRTLAEIENGIFCPKIFGKPDSPRRRRFGHLALPAPMVPFLWRHGSSSLLERLLGLPDSDIERIVRYEAVVVDQNGRIEVATANAEQAVGVPVGGTLGSGGAAIQSLLRRIPPDRLPSGLRGRTDALVPSAIPVTPADLRPIVLLDSGNLATSDLNDHYRSIINRRNRLAKLQELRAPAVILQNELRELQATIDRLHANTLLPEAAAVFGDAQPFQRLKDCISMVLGHLQADASKRVDWSGRARAVIAPSLEADQIDLPRHIFDTLQLSPSMPILVTTEDNPDGSFVALRPRSHDQNVIRLPAQAFERLGLGASSIPSCIVHRPLTREASAEAERLLQGDPGSTRVVPEKTGWIDGANEADTLSGLMEVALQASTIHLESPRGLIVAGAGSVDLVDDADVQSDPPKKLTKDIPEPPSAPRSKEPLGARIREIIESLRRKACVFTVTQAKTAVPPQAGRLGGFPYLPRDVVWPTSQGHSLMFLGQLPLEPARSAGLLPIEVEPGSLLTLFWGEDWWEVRRCSASCPVFVINPRDIVERPSPPDREALPLCTIEPRIVEEVPCWSEIVDIIEVELGDCDPKELKAFEKKDWKTFPEANNALKIGGWAHWIQGCDDNSPLLAQVVTQDEAEIMFGDSGTLYVLARSTGSLEVFTQCY
jgi:hypothetical protein